MSILGPPLPDSLSGIILAAVPPRLRPGGRRVPISQVPGATGGRGSLLLELGGISIRAFLLGPLFVTVKHFSLLKHINATRTRSGAVTAESPNLPLRAAARGCSVELCFGSSDSFFPLPVPGQELFCPFELNHPLFSLLSSTLPFFKGCSKGGGWGVSAHQIIHENSPK